MSDEMITSSQDKKSNAAMLISLVLSAAAVGISLAAYQKATGQDWKSMFKNKAMDFSTKAKLMAAKMKAYKRLAALEAQLMMQSGYEGAVKEVSGIRESLRALRESAGEHAQEYLQRMDDELSQLETGLRSHTADAVEMLRQTMKNMKHHAKA